ncbi:MAG: 23S rRNA (adenine(2503)-C(2))-methyltransferase RlmN [Candidatus Parcubacteria bacterium]|nr:23S rRNA (adenine(2503)-C(2))-methyltransferase RlmN [Candidatus Parcubacteria bacterium]
MNLENLQTILKNDPPFRLKQAKQAVFKDLITDWSQARSFPLKLREELTEECSLEIQAKLFISKDQNSVKALITFSDGQSVETVLMRHNDGRNTVCVSSQAGCALGCAFCATGKAGFKRNLTYFEIVEQALFFARYLKNENQKITNMVLMGMGEPFLNYDNVISAIRILNDKEGFGLGARRISISTCGIAEGIRKFAKENLEVNLAISLHAPDDALRSRIMPINKKYPLKEVLDAVDDYIKETKRRVMFEYIMIKDLNDSDEIAQKLVELAKRPLCFVNLISYNSTGIFKPSSSERIKIFKMILENEGVTVTQRYRFGDDIDAACGQLAAKKL